MTADELAAVIKGIAPVVREYVTSSIDAVVTVIESRVKTLETRHDDDSKAITALDLKFAQFASMPGPVGPPGEKGADGLNGKDGIDGHDGKAGLDGAAGRDGRDGKDGEIGPRGDVGPQGVAGKDGANGLNGKDADPQLIRDLQNEIKALRAELLTIKAMPDLATIEALVAARVSQLPVPRDGRDGKDIDPVVIDAMVQGAVTHAVKALPVPQDGRSVTVEEIAPLIKAEITAAVAALPKPKDGADGLPGRDGATGKDGINGKDGSSISSDDVAPLIKAEVSKAVAAIPIPKDGQSITVDDVAPFITAEIQRKFAAMPMPKDGVGVQSTTIDGMGHLIITFSDGLVKDLGRVVGEPGRDGLPGVPGRWGDKGADGRDGIDGKPGKDGVNGFNGKDGRDGLGFDDMDLIFEPEKGFTLRWKRGDQILERAIPVPYYDGTWKAGKLYPKGALLTVKGSMFTAMEPTRTRPDDGTLESSRAWRLCVKSGRDAKPMRDGNGAS